MTTLEEAIQKARDYASSADAVWFADPKSIIERPGYWFLPVGYIGSAGLIVDKADGRLHVMGSALDREDFFWGHENGFSSNWSVLRITRVTDLAKTIEFLFYAVRGGPGSARDPHPRREWLAGLLARPPCEFRRRRLWLRIPQFRSIREKTPWFEFEVRDETSPDDDQR